MKPADIGDRISVICVTEKYEGRLCGYNQYGLCLSESNYTSGMLVLPIGQIRNIKKIK